MPHIVISEQKTSPCCVSGWRFAPRGRGEHPPRALHCSSRSPKLILLLSSDGKSKPGSQSNYCPGCLLCCLSGASPGDKAKQGRNNLCCPSIPTFQTGVPHSHLDKRKLKRVHKSRGSAGTAFGSDVPAAGMTGQSCLWDFPLGGFVLLFFIKSPGKGKVEQDDF